MLCDRYPSVVCHPAPHGAFPISISGVTTIVRTHMEETIEFRCNAGFKADVESHANEMGMSVSEFMREAARRQLQMNIQNAKLPGDSE